MALSVKDDTRLRRLKASITKVNIAVVRAAVEQNACLSVKGIASTTDISEGSVQTILKKRMHLRKIWAMWVPHLLAEEHLKCAW